MNPLEFVMLPPHSTSVNHQKGHDIFIRLEALMTRYIFLNSSSVRVLQILFSPQSLVLNTT